MKKSKNIKLDDLNSSNLEETIKFIFQIKEKDVFDNELESLLEELKDESYKKIQPLILSNFILSKINQLNENFSFSKKFLKYSNDNFKIDLNQLIDIDQFENTRNVNANSSHTIGSNNNFIGSLSHFVIFILSVLCFGCT